MDGQPKHGVTRQVVTGSAASSIADYAKENEIDLIVQTTHGRTGLSRLLMGSIAESIVRNANCPVLTLKVREGLPKIKFQRILVPVDFSTPCENAIQIADSLVGGDHPELHLLHVAPPVRMVTAAPDVIVPASMVEAVTPSKSELKKKLREIKLSGEVPLENIRHVVAEGDPASDAVIDYAGNHNIDLIAMTTHGHSGISRLLMGSVAESVVRNASCPVLTLRSIKKE